MENASPRICARCGYDLRGSDPLSPCPECGSIPPIRGVDGDLLIVRSGAILPERCIKTNSLNKLTLVSKSVRVGTDRCQVVFYISSKQLTRARIKATLGAVILALGFSGITIGKVYMSPEFGMYIACLGFFIGILGFAVATTGPDLLIGMKYSDDTFWIKGCSIEFLKQIQEDLAPLNTPATHTDYSTPKAEASGS